MHGTDDRLTDPEASKRFAATVPPPLETHWLEGFYHEIFNETERARPLGLTVAWLEALLGASAE